MPDQFRRYLVQALNHTEIKLPLMALTSKIFSIRRGFLVCYASWSPLVYLHPSRRLPLCKHITSSYTPLSVLIILSYISFWIFCFHGKIYHQLQKASSQILTSHISIPFPSFRGIDVSPTLIWLVIVLLLRMKLIKFNCSVSPLVHPF